jgi:hypothetical protein
MHVFLANVSPAELTLLDQPIRPAREGGFKVLQTLEALADDLRMPYLYPTLRQLRDTDRFPHRILLVATDQSERGPSESDTIYFARAIQRLLAFHFGTAEDAVELHIFRGNPNDYEAAFDYYREMLQQVDGKVSWASLALTPAPAPMASALLVESLLRFGGRLQVLYAGKRGPDTAYGRVRILNLGQELGRLTG